LLKLPAARGGALLLLDPLGWRPRSPSSWAPAAELRSHRNKYIEEASIDTSHSFYYTLYIYVCKDGTTLMMHGNQVCP
jgi:hypothetical protein